MFGIDFKKLRREWKTFALGVVTSLVGLYDAFTASSLDYTPIIPVEYRPYAPLVIGGLFLLLRQYREYVIVSTQSETLKTETVTTVTPIEEKKVV